MVLHDVICLDCEHISEMIVEAGEDIECECKACGNTAKHEVVYINAPSLVGMVARIEREQPKVYIGNEEGTNLREAVDVDGVNINDKIASKREERLDKIKFNIRKLKQL